MPAHWAVQETVPRFVQFSRSDEIWKQSHLTLPLHSQALKVPHLQVAWLKHICSVSLGDVLTLEVTKVEKWGRMGKVTKAH